jgi:hypothetical protein
MLISVAACSANDGSATSSSGTTSGTTGGGSSAGGMGGLGGTGGSSSTGLGGDFGSGGFMPIPVHTLPLESITFWERSGGTAPTDYTFTINGPELTTILPDPMDDASHDIKGVMTEYYDVYYSNEDGTFNADGSYLTISGVFGQALPAGGGLNLAEIGLNYTDATTEFGNYVASYVVLGDNQNEMNVALCIDNDLQTHTTMGNTVGQVERLRVTLGFESTSGPPPQ